MLDDGIVHRRITETIPHVWTIDGAPQGVRHELIDHGDGTITARELRIDGAGIAHLASPEDERRLALVDAVHLIINATPEEASRTVRPPAILADLMPAQRGEVAFYLGTVIHDMRIDRAEIAESKGFDLVGALEEIVAVLRCK